MQPFSINSTQELSSDVLNQVKRLILFFDREDIESQWLGEESQLTSTSLKISSNESIRKYFDNANFAEMPKLSKRVFLVACTPEGVRSIHSTSQIRDAINQYKRDPEILQWKTLEIPKNLFKQLLNEIDLQSKKDRTVIPNQISNSHWIAHQDRKASQNFCCNLL